MVSPDAVDFEQTDEDRLDAYTERQKLGQAAVVATDWTTDIFLTQLTRDHIHVTPCFQRDEPLHRLLLVAV